MSAKTAVEQELLTATGQKERGKKESPQDYLVRISGAVSDMDDKEYEKLSSAAQEWFTQAADALNEEPPAPENIKPFADFEEEEAKEEAVEEEATEDPPEDVPEPKAKERAAPVKSSKKESPPAKIVKEKKEAVTKEPKEPKSKGPAPLRTTSVADTIRFVMCEDPSITKDSVAKALKEKRLSFDQSRLDQIYSGTARVLQILQELKKLK